ncbi:MAG TPA: aldo/keto reductase [bacterium]|jgi:aryl-alcohol dehydrogenase-like predicted oxidoreductase|nr:aldo/keto reductase [bacterium]
MKKIPLGQQGLKVSRLGLGCMGMSDFYGPRNDQESLETLQKALDIEINFLDTADIYGPFTNEELLGRFLQGRRSQVVIATKFGNQRTPDGKFLGISGKPEYVLQSCDASLKRLKIDTIDLYYQHRVDNTVPIEDTVGAMAKLVQQGKVRYLGLSEAGPQTIRRAHAVHPISALQTEYSLWSREPEDEILKTTRELGIGFVAYSPLGRGFLTGAFQKLDDLSPDDWRRKNPRFHEENFKKNLQLADQVKKMASEKKVTPAQLALAWVMAQGEDIVPIPGTRKISRLEENAGALEVKLTDEDLSRLNEAFPKGAAEGQRYPDMSAVNR